MSNFIFKDLTTPEAGSNLYEVRVNDWWIVDAKTGEQCFFIVHNARRYMYPQCNSNERITRELAATQEFDRETEVKQIPLVFIRRRYDD